LYFVQHPDLMRQDPPLALDSDFSQSDAAWAKAMERLKSLWPKFVGPFLVDTRAGWFWCRFTVNDT